MPGRKRRNWQRGWKPTKNSARVAAQRREESRSSDEMLGDPIPSVAFWLVPSQSRHAVPDQQGEVVSLHNGLYAFARDLSRAAHTCTCRASERPSRGFRACGEGYSWAGAYELEHGKHVWWTAGHAGILKKDRRHYGRVWRRRLRVATFFFSLLHVRCLVDFSSRG
jgi:hypothetical protein